jgi:GT2 family glycosyltransferase
MTVSVLILTWNGRQYLKECLESLGGQTFRDFETILVDNGSTDGSGDYVREHFPWVRLIELSENRGFSGGNLRGLQECRGRSIVTLNNDTRVEPEFLAELLAVAEADDRIGMVAAKMLNFYETGRIDSVGITVAVNGMAFNIGVGEPDAGQYDLSREVFGPCAGAALYRRGMLDEIGFFDAAFFAYYEDTDLAWRGQLAGWRCMTAPRAVVYHIHSATSGWMSPFTLYQVQRNKWYVLVKNWPALLLLRHLPQIIAYDIGSLLLAALRGRLGSGLRARLHVLRDLPLLLRKRAEVNRLRRLDTRTVSLLLTAVGGSRSVFSRKMGSGV